ncbi:hypothetical protein ROLI_025540 [Roseobacter fucihabitans]|uniref:Uncharacterized protein n=1 Tax=Roseobacter fucihabitans TaxID=1537242 RepID=A0ABZ2BTW9_9RHOB|nr:hypothetical protein [Roseobacter litoralis]
MSRENRNPLILLEASRRIELLYTDLQQAYILKPRSFSVAYLRSKSPCTFLCTSCVFASLRSQSILLKF